MGVLGWSPDIFWKATPYEFSCAYIGWCKVNGAGRWRRHEDGWTDAEVEEWKDVEAYMRAQHPDE